MNPRCDFQAPPCPSTSTVMVYLLVDGWRPLCDACAEMARAFPSRDITGDDRREWLAREVMES